jgi:phosphoribosylaminoimidazole-succinocarboxamide synthase
VREWLMKNGFQGRRGEKIPEMTDEIVAGISERYIELYENITGEKFDKSEYSDDVYTRIEANVENMLARLT